jgi:hypothetical protein
MVQHRIYYLPVIAKGIGTGTAIWMILTWAVSLFLGGMFASWFDGRADQTIGTTTVYGTVTLSGAVRDEASRDKAEQVVANTAGVKKVVDEMTDARVHDAPATHSI